MMTLHPTVARVTERLRERSAATRVAYLARTRAAAGQGPHRAELDCANLAHTFAACETHDKASLQKGRGPNVGIVTAYNDMLSAHQPYATYPALLKTAAREVGGVAQVAGGVPAMCDGITQGNPGMELSLFSREVIAMGTAVALSHAVFDGALLLGVCDKIVPGLFIGAMSFGHLPTVFVPAGPMPSGISNAEKAKTRQDYAVGKVTKEALLDSEAAAYHAPGTCTFYGTANTNQMLMEIMGLHLPGASFVASNTPLRLALTRAAAQRAVAMAQAHHPGIGELIDERSLINGVVGLLATGGSTNHTLHVVAMAAAAGFKLTWSDLAELSTAVPLLARVYPNGSADVNAFHAAGGMPFLIGQLLDAGLLHGDVATVFGEGGLAPYRQMPALDAGGLLFWAPPQLESKDVSVLRPASQPFAADGGLRVLEGNLGRSVIKVSAVKPEQWVVEAPARVFHSQDEVQRAFKAGELERDVVVVVRFQGPRANGMPELHKLTPPLAVLQERGFKVALVTDGRMSGASGKVPAAIHLTPEALAGGVIGKVRDGDVVRVDAQANTLTLKVSEEELAARTAATADLSDVHVGYGRELFSVFRHAVGGAQDGASVFFHD
jgi:phosphogluconate dehydratase